MVDWNTLSSISVIYSDRGANIHFETYISYLLYILKKERSLLMNKVSLTKMV